MSINWFILLQAPPNNGSSYYNYKGSINLMTISNAKYCFLMLNIGAEDRQSDGGVFRRSKIGIGFENVNIDLPEQTQVEINGTELPYVLVANEAFASTPDIMRHHTFPRSKHLNIKRKIFNYRLSRVRLVVESAFGLLAAWWRIYRKPINTFLSTAVKIVQTTTVLHNYIMQYEAILPPVERVYSQNIQDNSNLIHAGAFIEMDAQYKFT